MIYLFLLFTVAAIALSVFASLIFRRVVPTNMVHIVQSAKSTTVYGKGQSAGNSYFEWPSSLPFIGVAVSKFPESIFSISLESYDAYDAVRLPFIVDVTAFFRVSDASTVAQRVSSFEELEGQLHQVIRGSVRRILSKNRLEDIMEARSSLGAEFTAEVEEQIKEWGVFPVKSIEFMDLRDAKESLVILNIMNKEKSRIEMESRVQIATNKKEAELKEIDASRVIEVQKQDALEQVGIRTAEKEKAVGIAKEQSTQQIKEQTKITTEKEMAVASVLAVKQAEINKESAEVLARQEREVAAVRAEQDKLVKIKGAEAEKESTKLIAEGMLVQAQNEAEGTKIKGDALAAAEQAMLMAPVNTQITLAKEIGENPAYQQYLVTIKQIDAGQVVGLEMAKGIQGADVKIISNAGDIQSGVSKIGDMFTTAGGTNLTGMLAALAQSDEGKALVGRLTGKGGA